MNLTKPKFFIRQTCPIRPETWRQGPHLRYQCQTLTQSKMSYSKWWFNLDPKQCVYPSGIVQKLIWKKSNLPPAMSKRRRMQTVTTLPELPRFPPEPFFRISSFKNDRVRFLPGPFFMIFQFWKIKVVRWIQLDLVSWPSWQRCVQWRCCITVSVSCGDIDRFIPPALKMVKQDSETFLKLHFYANLAFSIMNNFAALKIETSWNEAGIQKKLESFRIFSFSQLWGDLWWVLDLRWEHIGCWALICYFLLFLW